MIKTLPLEKLRIDGGTQMRSLCESTVKEYTEAYQEAITLPAVRAVFDGSEYWLFDGFHRWHARRKAGLNDIKVEVEEGTRRDAVLHSCGVNSEHGLKRTNAAKRKAVETLLADAEWGKKSNRWIADACKVSEHTVASVRGDSTAQTRSSEPRQGKDGKTRKAPEPPVKSAKDQLREWRSGESEPEPETEDTPDYGACPNCKSTKWTEVEEGVSCAKCHHPYGEPAGDADEKRLPKSGSERSPAKLVDELLRKHFGPIVRGIDVVAEINGGKGDEFQRVNDALSVANNGLREMRKGKR